MASNYFASGTIDKTIVFPKPVKILNISVTTGTTFSFSVDGTNYMSVPVGLFSIPVGLITEIRIAASGGFWYVLAVQG